MSEFHELWYCRKRLWHCNRKKIAEQTSHRVCLGIFGEQRQEIYMSSTIRSVCALCLVVLVAACGNNQEEEFVVVEPEPISVEPTYTGKLK